MHDLRLAFRALRATPIVSIVAALSLALGIGANTAIFSLVNSLLLRTLPVRESHRLTTISSPMWISRAIPAAWPNPVWEQIRERTELFDGTCAWGPQRFNLAQGGEAQFVDGLWVDGSFFDVMGLSPLVGRTLTDADDRRGGGPDGAVAVISYGFWQRRFGGAPDVIGQGLTLDGVPFTVVGVAPQDFHGVEVGRTFDVIVPLGDEPLVRGRETWLDNSRAFWLTIMARLKPGQTIEVATASLRGVQPQIREATLPENVPVTALAAYLKDPFTLVSSATGTSRLRSRYERPLLAIMVLVALVLLIACANIANLLMARAMFRRHELSVRRALGATRWRLARQLFAESALLAIAGATLGVLFASWSSRFLMLQLSTPNNPVFLDPSLDGRVLIFSAGATIMTALLFGTAPALRGSGVAPMDALKGHGPGKSDAARGVFASGLVVVQVALSVVIVVAAVLFVRSFVSLASVPLGFEADRVLLVTVNAQRATVAPPERAALYERAREAIGAVPGVEASAVSFVAPVGNGGIVPRIQVSGGVSVPDNEFRGNGFGNIVSPGWFRTFGIPFIAGRDFTARDGKGAPPVAIVNHALARAFLNGASPLGHTITLNLPDTERMEIIGMVGDSVYNSLREGVPPTVYMPIPQFSGPPAMLVNVTISVRANGGSPVQLTKSIAAAIASVDPRLALTFRPLTDQVDASLVQERLVATLSGFFGGLALLLAGVGLYGVTSYAVTRRRAEIGIRMALGAEPSRIVRLVLSRVTRLVALGVLVGAATSMWASRFVAALLYGLEPRDPATLAGAVAILALVGLLAGGLPAHRASRIDPSDALRRN